jgi:hypothetical protein
VILVWLPMSLETWYLEYRVCWGTSECRPWKQG